MNMFTIYQDALRIQKELHAPDESLPDIMDELREIKSYRLAGYGIIVGFVILTVVCYFIG